VYFNALNYKKGGRGDWQPEGKNLEKQPNNINQCELGVKPKQQLKDGYRQCYHNRFLIFNKEIFHRV
jgi:hypothetical protein